MFVILFAIKQLLNRNNYGSIVALKAIKHQWHIVASSKRLALCIYTCVYTCEQKWLDNPQKIADLCLELKIIGKHWVMYE